MLIRFVFTNLKSEFQVQVRRYNSRSLFVRRGVYNKEKMKSVIDENPVIDLNEQEIRVTTLLKDYTEAYNKVVSEGSDEEKKPICLRITGGWVRDKLLGKVSHDIDIAIDHLSGVEFAEGLKQYILDNHLEGEAFDKNSTNNLHKIEKNPDKSKHLETCTTKIYGNDIDFVNLRSEKYTEESRIPVIDVGTPEEDALRRDATLNALFFNLTTMKVEDLTGRGLQDLKDGILRTPLEPETTFLDDPLRCLRLIRFAANYNFDIDPKASDSMSRENIKIAAQTKVSRERVGIEIKKMLLGINPFYGLELLTMTKLYDVIFEFGEYQSQVKELNKDKIEKIEYNLSGGLKESLINIQEKLPVVVSLLADKLPEVNKILDDIMELKYESTDKENVKLALILSLVLIHWKDMELIYMKKKFRPASNIIILDGIKLPMKTAELVSLIVSKNQFFVEELDSFAKAPTEFTRADVANKFVNPYGENWLLMTLVSCFVQCFNEPNTELYEKIIMNYDFLIKKVRELELSQIYTEKRIVDGKEVAKILDKKPGPWMREVNDKILIHQYNYPSISKDEMIEYVKKLTIE